MQPLRISSYLKTKKVSKRRLQHASQYFGQLVAGEYRRVYGIDPVRDDTGRPVYTEAHLTLFESAFKKLKHAI